MLGLLPARSGSKGLPGKNLMQIGGKTLVEWSGQALVDSSYVTKAICSTDSEEIGAAAKRVGLEVPFLRPKSISGDSAPVIESIFHALDFLATKNQEKFEFISIVQATSPTVTSADIDRAFEHLVQNDFDTVFSAQKLPSHFHPAVTFSQTPGKEVDWTMDSKIAAQRRQNWPSFYARTGLVYVFRVSRLMLQRDFYSGKTGFIEVEPERAIGIDTIEDFVLAKEYLEIRQFRGS